MIVCTEPLPKLWVPMITARWWSFSAPATISEALAEPVAAIVDAVKTTLDKTPPELAADIMEDGITITGGGALLGGLDERLAHETGMPIRVAAEPLCSYGPRYQTPRSDGTL